MHFLFHVKRRKVRDYKGIDNSLLIRIITNLFFLTLTFESNSGYLFTHTYTHYIHTVLYNFSKNKYENNSCTIHSNFQH